MNNKSGDFQQPDNSLKMFGIKFFLDWQIVNGKESIYITVFFPYLQCKISLQIHTIYWTINQEIFKNQIIYWKCLELKFDLNWQIVNGKESTNIKKAVILKVFLLTLIQTSIPLLVWLISLWRNIFVLLLQIQVMRQLLYILWLTNS